MVEDVFVDFFDSIDRQTEPTAFDGRSDYDAFVAAGIPAGGLFTGAEDIMTAEQAAKWEGTAGVAFDSCYHEACDTFTNVNLVALDEMTDAIAHAILTFAMTTSAVQGTGKGSDKATYEPTFRGTGPSNSSHRGWGGSIAPPPMFHGLRWVSLGADRPSGTLLAAPPWSF
ncbi:MAG TPA: M28 family peptidase [Propionibacteriaceae bacterium]